MWLLLAACAAPPRVADIAPATVPWTWSELPLPDGAEVRRSTADGFIVEQDGDPDALRVAWSDALRGAGWDEELARTGRRGPHGARWRRGDAVLMLGITAREETVIVAAAQVAP